MRQATWIGGAAAVALTYAGYCAFLTSKLRRLYGDDDRILIQLSHAVAGLVLAVALIGWALAVRAGSRTAELKDIVKARPAAWSGWMVAVLAAVVAGLLTFFYDAGRAATDARNAVAGRGVHGVLTVTGCAAQEYGFTCEGTFRADDGSFTVERVTAWPETDPGKTLEGWVSGPRPLAMFDGTDGPWRNALLQIGVLAAFWLPLAGYLVVVIGRKAAGSRQRPEPA